MKSSIEAMMVSVLMMLVGCPTEDGGASAADEPQAGQAAPAVSAVRDDCAMAEASSPTDLSSLGALAACAPPGVALPCRVDSPAYTCNASPSAEGSALNQCRNAADCAVLDAIDAQAAAMTGPVVSNIVRGCGLPYITGTNSDCASIASSASACVMSETSGVLAPGLSAGCAGCFTQSLLCNLRCLAHCSIDAESPACVACMHVEGCRGLFYQCSGLEPMN